MSHAMDIPPITVDPAGPHSHTVVFLHGRGDNARNFMASLSRWRDSTGRSLADALPSFRWVFPQAPMRVVAASAATPGQQPTVFPQWFDVWNTRDFADHEQVQIQGLRESVSAIRRLLAREAALVGGRWDRLVLAGISMGGATSVHTLFHLDIPESAGGRLAALAGFSCRCPLAGRTLAQMRQALDLGLVRAPPGPAEDGDGGLAPDSVIRRTPVLLEHCVDDPLVLVENGRTLRETLVAFGAQVEWREYPSGGHWFHSPTGLDDLIGFLNAQVLGQG